MPTSLLLHLEGPSSVEIPVGAAHAALSARIDIDHHSRVKPFSIGPPRDSGHGVAIRVGLLGNGLGERLADSFEADQRMRLGRHWYTAAGMEIERDESWEALGGRPRSGAWEVDFVTPTTFRRRARSTPWPAPESIAKSLVERWRALDAATAPWIEDLHLKSIWVSDIRGESYPIQGPDSLVSGFVGTIRYVADADSQDGGAFGRLLGLAEFGGLGALTAFGFGQVVVRTAQTSEPTGHR